MSVYKNLQIGKRLLFNSDSCPPTEEKLKMPCDIINLNFSRWTRYKLCDFL